MLILIGLGIFLVWLACLVLTLTWSHNYFKLSFPPSIYEKPGVAEVVLALWGPVSVVALALFFLLLASHPEHTFKWRLR